MVSTQSIKPIMAMVEVGHPFAPGYDSTIPLIPITTSEWQHLCPCRFGEPRPCSFSSSTKWTGDSYRYDIFIKPDAGRVTWALRWWNGGGQGWLLYDHRKSSDGACLLEAIANDADENRRWDFCHFLWQVQHKTQHAAALGENQRMSLAFLEKRLKRRQHNHKISVEVLPQKSKGKTDAAS